jgi:hypothetical protein
VPKVLIDVGAILGEVRVSKGAVRVSLTIPAAQAEDVMHLAEAQASDEDGVQLVLVSLRPQSVPIPGTEDPRDWSDSRRAAVGMRLLDALTGDVEDQTDHVTGEIAGEGETPPPFPPGTPVGRTPAEIGRNVVDLADRDPARAAGAASDAVRRGASRRGRRRAETAAGIE